MNTSLVALRLLLVLSVLTGFAYPLLVTGIGQSLFHHAASGSLVKRGEAVIGSALLAQKTESPTLFWPRPSGGDFATLPSGASNFGPSSEPLRKAIAERRVKFGTEAPDDLLTASGSGLDPHLSPMSAKYQAPRVAAARHVPVAEINALIDRLTEGPQLGFLGEPRVNVLALNLALPEPH